MKIKMIDKYHESYYRKQGLYCFDFTNDIRLASELTEEEAIGILNSEAWYLKMYGADRLVVI